MCINVWRLSTSGRMCSASSHILSTSFMFYYEMLFSLYSGRMEIARQTGPKTSSSESGIHVLQFHFLHLVVVAHSQFEVTPVDCGRTLRSRPACLC